MTNINTNWKMNSPFKLIPAAKNYLWGGNKLNEIYHKNIPMSPLAETWECSTHEDGPSIVASGMFQGMDLKNVLIKHPEFLGTHPRTKNSLPILLKLIDAKEKLSIQVHPSDEYAYTHENGSLGKVEMWYVIEAEEGATLTYGFKNDMNPDIVKKAIENGTIEQYLNQIEVHKGDIFYIDAGMVHAIGTGILIAEIQESSNITYRLFDYNRIDRDGKTRELHIDKSLDVLNYKAVSHLKQPMKLFNYKLGCQEELLCRCKYFEVRKQILNTIDTKEPFDVSTQTNSFKAILCLEGHGKLKMEESVMEFSKGECIFIPANSHDLFVEGKTTILSINC